MNTTTRRFTAGIALLLVGLSLTTAVNLTAPRSARANPGVLYAAPTAQGSGNCSSWANACTLQTALAQAVSGDEIWVKAGVHYPGAAGNRWATFTLKNGVALYGGFAGTETSRDQRDWQANLTILSGDIDKNDNHGGDYINENTSQIMGKNAYHVVTGSRTDATAVLNGLVITAGQGDFAAGGGMYNYEGNPTLTNVTFSGNSAYYGGGMYNYKSSPTLTNITFSGSSASSNGGGIYNEQSSPRLTDITFSNNSAEFYGGGMYNKLMSHPALINVAFRGNTAKYGGGMVNEQVCFPNLTNVTFSGNSADIGGGMLNYNSSPRLINITFSGNSAYNGSGMYNSESNPQLINVIMWGNNTIPNINNFISNPQISYSDIQGCRGSGNWNRTCGSDGGGNIDADPRFVDAAGGNLRLRDGSPAIDAGNNAAVPAGVTTDLDGKPRFVDIPEVPDTGRGAPPIVDMGAYEAQSPDTLPPTVASIARADASPTSAASVRFRVTFSEAVTGVDAGDFSLTATGITGAAVTDVSGSGAVYTVTVSTGSGTGILRLDIPTGASITDLVGNPLAGLPYTRGEAYMVRPLSIYLPLVVRNAP